MPSGRCLPSKASRFSMIPKNMHVCNAVAPEWATAFTFTPYSSKILMLLVAPVWQATMRGVLPLSSGISGSAPASKRRRAHSGESVGFDPFLVPPRPPFCPQHAMQRAVLYSLAARLMSVFGCFSSTATLSSLPIQHAFVNAVLSILVL